MTMVRKSFIPLGKWLIAMVSFRALRRVVGPLPNGLFLAYTWGVTTHLLIGMALHVDVNLYAVSCTECN